MTLPLTPETLAAAYEYLRTTPPFSRSHRGKGLQLKFLRMREAKAREIGWTMLVSECGAENAASASNFIKAGFTLCEPEQCWGAPGSIYFVKRF